MLHRITCNIFNKKHKDDETDVHPIQVKNGSNCNHIPRENTPLRTGKRGTIHPDPITEQITGNDKHGVPGSLHRNCYENDQTEVKRPISTDNRYIHPPHPGDNLRSLNKIQHSQILERKEQITQLQEELQRVKSERDEALSRQSDSEMKHKILTLEEQIQQLKQEKNEILIRLSEYTSKHVADNNPNIADLGDMNRPTKLVERFSELYDNEWTEAFEYLQKIIPANGPEKAAVEAIKTLLNVLQKIYNLCKREASSQLQKTVKSIYGLTKREKNYGPIKRSLKEFKDERKQNYLVFLPDLNKQVESIEELEVHRSRDVPVYSLYITKATELCWLMSIQDPPMELCFSGRNRKEFDCELFKAYTQTGKKVAFIVWPAVLLSENGSTLMKGVAQGKTRKKDSLPKHAKKRKSNVVESIEDKEIPELNAGESSQRPAIDNFIAVEESPERIDFETDKHTKSRNVATVALNGGVLGSEGKQGDSHDDDDDVVYGKPNDRSQIKDSIVSSYGNSELTIDNLDTIDEITLDKTEQDHGKMSSIDKTMRASVKHAFPE